jgi:tetratricopeptide (TPR) repeat protein
MRCPWHLLLASSFMASCATDPTVSFQTDGKSKVAAVSWDNLEGEGQSLGETPLTFKASDVSGKVVRITQDKKVPQYWVVACDSRREKLDARLKMSDLPPSTAIAAAPDPEKKQPEAEAAGKPGGVPPEVLNKSHRMLLQAYEALVSADYKLAREIADQLATEVPSLASPFIIIGLSYMQAGDREQARGAFAKAANLDPEDAATKELIQMTQF